MTGGRLWEMLVIEPGTLADYKRLAVYHYRSARLGAVDRVFVLRLRSRLGQVGPDEPMGVIVYTMPAASVELRNVALGGALTGLDRASRLAVLNAHFRCIARVIIDPRLRGLGLAVRLVRQTLGQVDVPIVEALAVMGRVNPFFEKAGMQAYRAPLSQRAVQMLEAFSLVGIEQQRLWDPAVVQDMIESLEPTQRAFIERQMGLFLQGYGQVRLIPAGPERTEAVLSRLFDRPVYYIWFNPNGRCDCVLPGCPYRSGRTQAGQVEKEDSDE